MPTAFIADVEFTWGHASRQIGLSKSPPSFLYPPPTTIVGALAASMAKRNNWGEKAGREVMALLGSNLLAISVKPLNFIPIRFQDVNRIVTVKVTSGVTYPQPRGLSRSFDAPARGKTVFATLNDEPPVMRVALVFSDTSFEGVNLKEDDLWRINRIGAKEAVVSVLDVRSMEVEGRKGEFLTSWSFPLVRGVTPLKEVTGEWAIESYLNPFSRSSYLKPYSLIMGKADLLDFMVPRSLVKPKYRVSVGEGASAFDLDGEVVIGVEF